MPEPGRSPIARELARKAIHLCSAIVPVLLAVGVAQRILVAGLAALLAIAIVVELARHRWPRAQSMFQAGFGALLRAREQRSVTGATWLLAAMLAAVWILPRDAAIVATWAVAVGDASAALIGMPFGRHRIGSGGKSLEGSLACAIVTLLGAALLARMPAGVAIAAGIVAAVAELLPWPRDDNARIVTLVGGAAWAWRATPY